MRKLYVIFLFFNLMCFSQKLPKGFSYLKDVAPTIQQDLRYITSNNFLGTPVNGYKKAVVITTTKTANALKKVQESLAPFGLSLKVYDAYRPQQAVNHFVKWAKDVTDTIKKQGFYPKIDKRKLFKLGYISSKSGHTRGSSVDLTLADVKTGKELDMGSSFDFFGIESHPKYTKITAQQKANRMLLRYVMILQGFRPYKNEWWHFTLNKEPFPNTYHNFPIE